jgi:hypothetical protein
VTGPKSRGKPRKKFPVALEEAVIRLFLLFLFMKTPVDNMNGKKRDQTENGIKDKI